MELRRIWMPPRRLLARGRSGRTGNGGFVNACLVHAAGLFAMNNWGVPWSVPRMNPTHLTTTGSPAVQFYAT